VLGRSLLRGCFLEGCGEVSVLVERVALVRGGLGEGELGKGRVDIPRGMKAFLPWGTSGLSISSAILTSFLMYEILGLRCEGENVEM
jgi:hypothetical protein